MGLSHGCLGKCDDVEGFEHCVEAFEVVCSPLPIFIQMQVCM